MQDIVIKKGSAVLVEVKPNFYGINPPPIPRGWNLTWKGANVDKKASISINAAGKVADVKLDRKIFDNPDIPEGCKIFIVFHEIGHLIFGPAEELCDEFAFWNSLYLGVSPYLCYVAIRAYMPEHYDYRIERLGRLLLKHPQLKNNTDADYGFSDVVEPRPSVIIDYKGFEILLSPWGPVTMRTPEGDVPYMVQVSKNGEYLMATKGPAGNEKRAAKAGVDMVEGLIRNKTI